MSITKQNSLSLIVILLLTNIIHKKKPKTYKQIIGLIFSGRTALHWQGQFVLPRTIKDDLFVILNILPALIKQSSFWIFMYENWLTLHPLLLWKVQQLWHLVFSVDCWPPEQKYWKLWNYDIIYLFEVWVFWIDKDNFCDGPKPLKKKCEKCEKWVKTKL